MVWCGVVSAVVVIDDVCRLISVLEMASSVSCMRCLCVCVCGWEHVKGAERGLLSFAPSCCLNA